MEGKTQKNYALSILDGRSYLAESARVWIRSFSEGFDLRGLLNQSRCTNFASVLDARARR